MRSVTVVGGGISGLATAYYLSLAGIPVEIVERSDRLGGLIATHRTPHGPVETAAIAMKNGARVDAVCRDLGVPMLSSAARRPGYIYRDGPRRWPLGVGETLSLAARYAVSSVSGQRRPRPLETVDAWSNRVLGRAAAPWLVGPFLQGRYAGDPVRLSASLLFGPKQRPAPGPAGIVSPVQGMQQLIDASQAPVNGTVRPSRAARVFARLIRMRKIQVFSDERPSNAQMPWITPSQVSCTTSSATARLET